MSNEVNLTNFGSGTLPPGGIAWWFMDNVAQNRVRWFTAVPVGGKNYINRDQMIEVTQVFTLQKGTNHASEGAKVVGEIQVNVVVTNLDPNNECVYAILMAETDNGASALE